LQTTHPDSSTAHAQGHTLNARVFLSHRFPFGQSRFESRFTNQNGPAEERFESEMRWDHDWEFSLLDRLTTETEYFRDSNGANEVLLGVTAERFLSDTLRSNLNIQAIDRDDGKGASSTSVNLGFGFSWQAHRDLSLALTGSAGRDKTKAQGSASSTVNDAQLLFTLRYARESGRVPLVYGGQTGQEGTGRVSGCVFLDADRDDRYGINEDVIPRITVFLDGRFKVETDQQGRFEFYPVPAGEHFLRVAVEDAPLRWGLDDESARSVIVPIRGVGRLYFGLINLSE
jgi:hypothetical protein